MEGQPRHLGLSQAVERLSAGLAIGRRPLGPRLHRVEDESGPLPSAAKHAAHTRRARAASAEALDAIESAVRARAAGLAEPRRVIGLFHPPDLTA